MQDDNFIDPLTYREPEEAVAKSFAIPERSMNVEAATLSALAEDDTKALQQYQNHTMTPRERQARGLETEYEQLTRNYDEFVRRGMTSLMADTSIPGSVRQGALEAAPTAKYSPKDPAALLGTAAALEPSKGETDVGAEVRSILAEGFVKSHNYLDSKQQIINNAVNRHDGTLTQIADTLSRFLVPGQDAALGVQLAGKLGKSLLRGGAMPGSLMQDLNKEFLALPIDERLNFTKTLAEAVAKSSGILTNQNLLRFESAMQDITDEEGFSDGQEAWVNVMNLLDFAGIGLSLRAVGKAGTTFARTQAARRAEANSTFSQFERAGRDIPMDRPPNTIPGVNGEASVTSVPQVMANTDEVSRVEAELAQARGLQGSRMSQDELEQTRSSLALIQNNKERMAPSASLQEVNAFQARRAERQQTLNELQDKLNTHTEAVRAEENVASLEDRLNTLRQTDYETNAPKTQLQQALDRAYTNSIIAPTHPRAPANILAATNFEKGRAAYAQAVMDEGGQFAEAMYGTSRTEAIVSQIAPQAGDSSGRVVRKLEDPERSYRDLLSSGMDKIVNNIRDGLRYTPTELAAGRAAVVRDFTDTTSMKLNDSMTHVSYDGDRVTFSGVYTNGQGGWASASDAVEQAKYALRNRGLDDSNIQVMRLEGDEMVPTTVAESAGQPGVYAIKVDVSDSVKDRDIADWDNLDVKRNFFDRFAGKGKNSQGSFQQHIVEPNSMFPKTLTGSMAVSEDKSSIVTEALLRKFEGFGQAYRKLDKGMRDRLDEYLIKANIEELPFDANALRANFPQNVVDMIRDWRDAWDSMYILENADVIKSLEFEGYRYFQHANIEAVVKKATQGYRGERIYDPVSDSSKVLTDAELKDIRDKGGYIGRFRSSMDLNGYDVGFMVVRDTPTEYARGFSPNDRILNYRNGYYQVQYKTPKFIEEASVDSSGKKTVKVVGIAGTTREAKEIAERMKLSNPTKDYNFRGDEKTISRDRDVYWELNSSFGRLAQRHRGQLLEDTVGMQYGNANDLIENPAESAIRASMSLGGRIAMRDAITTAKTRWMNQYGDLVAEGFPKEFPASRDQIFKKGEYTTGDLRDARSTWNYINTMENGYVNAMDAGLKLAFNHLADAAGLKGWDTVEKLLHSAGDINLTGKAKSAAFLSYLATNPLRMWIVQGAQALRLSGYSHIHMPKVFAITEEYIKTRGVGTDFADFYKSTGIFQSLNRSNLVRGTLLEAAQRQNVTGRMVDTALQNIRRVGFDAGENFNNVTTAAAVFEKYRRLGEDVKDLNVRANMHAEVRALTRNMNRAGDMPYNHNYLALVFTYMQVPHKFALQGFDRTLTRAERTRLIAADMMLWGLPAGLGTYVATQEGIGDNPVMKAIAEEGLAAMFFNGIFSHFSGQESRIDFSSMAPWDLTGFGEIFTKMVGDEGMAALLTESPAGRILGFSADSRIGFAMRTTGRMFSSLTDDDLTRTTVVDAVDAWARVSSGWNNIQEAVLMYQLGRATDKQGRTTDDQVTLPEIAAKVFGFGTKDTKEYYETVIKHTRTVKGAQEHGKAAVKETMQMIRHLANGDLQGAKAISLYTQAMLDPSNFPDRTTYQASMAAAMTEFHNSANNKLMQKFMSDIGMPSTYEDFITLTRGAPLEPEQKDILIKFFKDSSEFVKKIEEANKE